MMKMTFWMAEGSLAGFVGLEYRCQPSIGSGVAGEFPRGDVVDEPRGAGLDKRGVLNRRRRLGGHGGMDGGVRPARIRVGPFTFSIEDEQSRTGQGERIGGVPGGRYVAGDAAGGGIKDGDGIGIRTGDVVRPVEVSKRRDAGVMPAGHWGFGVRFNRSTGRGEAGLVISRTSRELLLAAPRQRGWRRGREDHGGAERTGGSREWFPSTGGEDMQSGGSATEDVEMPVVVQGAGRIRHGQAPQDGSRFDVENGDRLIESDGELSACSGYGGDSDRRGERRAPAPENDPVSGG